MIYTNQLTKLRQMLYLRTGLGSKFGLKELETSIYRIVRCVFRYLEPFGLTRECDRHL